jgi:hypothetical protein
MRINEVAYCGGWVGGSGTAPDRGGAPSLPVPLPRQPPRRRSAGFIVVGLQGFVVAMAVLKRCLEEGIDGARTPR